LFRLLDKCGYPNAKLKRKQQHARWNCLWLLHQGVASVPRLHARISASAVTKAFHEFRGNGLWGRRARTIVKRLTKAVWSAYRKGRSADPERWTPNNFFKSKYGNKLLQELTYPKVRKELQILGNRIVEHV
jgi:hypothetical protein